jgi:hypothetical protein
MTRRGGGDGKRGRRPGHTSKGARSLPVLPISVGVGLALVLIGILVALARSSPSPQNNTPGRTIDGVQCQTSEQAAVHVHAHLAIFVNGSAQTVSQGIGIPGGCMYWLHTHDADGVVHVEAPQQRQYTLGTFFDIWGKPLGPSQVGGDRGTVVAYVNGQRFTGNPRDIPLTEKAVIQLGVGAPVVAPSPYTFSPNS